MKTVSFNTGKEINDNNSLEIGTILWFKGYGRDGDQYAVISEGTKTSNQRIARLTDGKSSAISRWSVGRWENSSAIGYYFPKPGNPIKLTHEKLTTVIALNEKYQQDLDKSKLDEQQERLRKEEIVKEIFKTIPEDAVTMIVGALEQNESDYSSDYHGSKTVKTILLSYSKHTRDLFTEMRKAALNAEETKHFATDNNPKHENREKYSMGAGYYLGENRYSGWQVYKIRLNRESPSSYLWLAEPDAIRIPGNEKTTVSDQTTDKTTGIMTRDYSEKSIVVYGDTKPIKDKLSELNGKFNAHLKDGKGNKFAGWIFPKTRKEQVEQFLKGL